MTEPSYVSPCTLCHDLVQNCRLICFTTRKMFKMLSQLSLTTSGKCHLSCENLLLTFHQPHALGNVGCNLRWCKVDVGTHSLQKFIGAQSGRRELWSCCLTSSHLASDFVCNRTSIMLEHEVTQCCRYTCCEIYKMQNA